jgi:peptidoglycan/LPS O-acetylase OafA/YrhL
VQTASETLRQKSHYFTGLDVVRTVLALSVACGHFLYWSHTSTRYPASFFLAVDFFFALSGFVLTQSVMNDRSVELKNFATGFIARRFFRLYPLYIALFIPSALATAAHFGADEPANYLASIALTQGIGVLGRVTPVLSDSMIGIAWSISVEIWAGVLFFPLIFALRRTPRRIIAVCAIISVACLAIMAVSPHHFDVNVQRFAKSISFGFIRGLLGFSIGTICFLAYQQFGNMASRAATSLAEIALLVIVLILFAPNGRNGNFDFAAPFLIGALLMVLASECGVLGAALCSAKLAWLRPLSYSIYLIHPMIIFAWKHFDIPFSNASALPYMALVLILSAPLYKLIEAPGIRLGRRIQSHRNKEVTRRSLEPFERRDALRVPD